MKPSPASIIADLLPAAQQVQLAGFIAQVQAVGFGHVEIRIENHRAKWFRPTQISYNNSREGISARPAAASLEALLGDWQPDFASALAAIAGHGFGGIEIGIRHKRIVSIASSHDVRPRTGKTGELDPRNLSS